MKQASPELGSLLATASAQQAAGDSAAALWAYEQALPLLSGVEHLSDRARVLFQVAQLARFEGQIDRAYACYDELLQLTAELGDIRAHGLSVAMCGQLRFLQGERAEGIQAMIRGLDELRQCGATEAEHLTCHTRFFSRRLPRPEFERCVRAATADVQLQERLLRAGDA